MKADTPLTALRKALMLQINENLYKQDVISREVYEKAKTHITDDR